MSATAVHSLWTMAADPTGRQDRRAEDRVRPAVAHPDRRRRGDRRDPRRGVRAAQVPLLRPGVPVRRRASPPPSPRSSALAAGGYGTTKAHIAAMGAIAVDGPALFLQGTILLVGLVARLHLRRAAARPGGARQPRRLLRRAGRVRARQRQREGRGQGRVHHHRGVPAAAVRGRRHAGLPGGQRPADAVHRAGGLLAPAVPAVRAGPPQAAHVAGGRGQVLPARRLRLRVHAVRHRPAVRLRGLRVVRDDRARSSTARSRTIDPALADTMGNDALLLDRRRDGRHGPAVQGRRRAVPHVDAGRLPGRADPGDRLHGGGDQGGRVRRAAAAAVRRAAGPALGLAAGHVGRRDRHHAGRCDRRDHADRHQAAAGVLVDRARRASSSRVSSRPRRTASRPCSSTWPRTRS